MQKTKKWSNNYFKEMLQIHGKNPKTVRNAILNNLVNSEYGRTSNQQIIFVWAEYNEYFKS